MRRVVVTGIGSINALGRDTSTYWSNLARGHPGIVSVCDRWKRVSAFYDENTTPWIGAEIPDYTPEAHFSRRELLLLDPVSQFALLAAREAVEDARIPWSDTLRGQTAIVMGTSVGGDESRDEASYRFFSEKERISNFTIIRSMDNAPTSHLSIRYGITGPCYTIQSACASSAQAIAQAYMMLRQGMVDCALAGGTENLPSHGLFKAWESMRILANDTCRPFSKNRKGLVLGEGAGILVLEPLDLARARNAPIYAEIAGFSMTSDAHDIVAPSQAGAEHAMRAALRQARLEPTDIDYLNAHGTGTPSNDVAEAAAIRQVFGDHAEHLAVSSTKSMHGHGLGATSAFEAIACIMALKRGLVPPNINYEEPDPKCELNLVVNEAAQLNPTYAMSNSFGFGGSNGVLIFKKWEA